MSGSERSASTGAGRYILIVGGYGVVGQRIARLLIDEFGPRLVIGGRHRQRAGRVARAMGGDVGARAVDVADAATFEAALNNVETAIVCVDTDNLQFAHACVTRGIHVIDITASFAVIERLGFLNDLACAHGAAIVSSVGLAPGLTNLMAKTCASAADIKRVEIHVLLGLGERHGGAALSWMADRLSRSFDLATPDGPRTVWPFQAQSRTRFPAPFGVRTTYRFDFSDQHTLPSTLGLDQVSTWITVDRVTVARTIAWLARRGALRGLRYASVRRAGVVLLRLLRHGSTRFAISVDATHKPPALETLRVTASGCEEAHATAVIAAQTARQFVSQPPPAGAHQLDQLYDLDTFEQALAQHDIDIERHWSNVSNPLNERCGSAGLARGEGQ